MKFSSQFPQRCFKTQKKLSLAICGIFWGEKPFLLILFLVRGFAQKKMFPSNESFPKDPFQTCWENIFCAILSFFQRYFCFDRNEKFPVNFSENPSKLQKMLSLAIFSSFWGGKKVLAIMAPFYWSDQKMLFLSKMSVQDLLLFKVFEKNNSQSNS